MMKIRKEDRMSDSFTAQLLFVIEQLICDADLNAKDIGITLKDSQIQSSLIKAAAIASGKNPKVEDTTEIDQILKDLIIRITQAPDIIIEKLVTDGQVESKAALRAVDWIAAIKMVVDSIKTRRSGIPGAREYLDFVHQFIANAKKTIDAAKRE